MTAGQLAPAGVRVGVQFYPQHTSFDALRGAWLAADALGVDSLFSCDHLMPLTGDLDGSYFEGWMTLAAIAPRTRAPVVGCLVSCMGYRNPNLLANMANTLQHALGGRLVLGLGAGWVQREYDAYGYEFGTPATRLRTLEAGLQTIRARLSVIQPRPLGDGIPILIGGSGERVTLRLAAQYADLWHGGGAPELFGHKCRVLDDWCRRVGREPGAATSSMAT